MLNRRELIKRSALTAGALAIAGPGVVLQTACGSTKQLVKWAGVALAYLRDLLPILSDVGAVKIVDLVNRALPIVEKLKKTLEENDNVGTFDALESLTSPTGIIAQIAEEVGLINDEAKRRIIMGVLAGVQLTLRLIAAQMQQDVPPAAQARARAARPTAVRAMENAAGKLEETFTLTRFK